MTWLDDLLAQEGNQQKSTWLDNLIAQNTQTEPNPILDPNRALFTPQGLHQPGPTGLEQYLASVLQQAGSGMRPEPFLPGESTADYIKRTVPNFDYEGLVQALPIMGLGTKGITAYHGSPHDFERFSTSAIGTGEGAQAYGHGLYFAENENVARDYKENIAPKDFGSLAEQKAFDVLRGYGRNRDTAITNLRAEATSLREQAARRPAMGLGTGKGWNVIADQADKAADLLEQGWKPPEGKMYQVSINADPERFLDWDKPLSEQSPQVQEALKNIPNMANARTPNPTGAQIHELADLSSRDVGGSDVLRQAGIPGIKYLDQGSRGLSLEDLNSRLAAIQSKLSSTAPTTAADRNNIDALRTR